MTERTIEQSGRRRNCSARKNLFLLAGTAIATPASQLRRRPDCSMVRSVKMNYPSDQHFRDNLWECQHCSYIDTQSHIILTCPAYEDLRVNKDLESDKDLVQFFKEVLDKRDDK